MKIFFLVLLLICSLCRADWSEEDPSIFQHVNVISGNLNLSFRDKIRGAVPLEILRTYTSAGALECDRSNSDLALEKCRKGWLVQGGWSFFSHTNLCIQTAYTCKEIRLYLAEPDGRVIAYEYSHKDMPCVAVFKPAGSQSYLKQCLYVYTKEGRAVLHLPDGGKRFFEGAVLHHFYNKKDPNVQNCFYRLVKEDLPSQHSLHYSYDENTSLTQVELISPAGRSLSGCSLSAKKGVIQLEASDQSSYEMKFRFIEGRAYLKEIEGSSHISESFKFTSSRKKAGARLESLSIGGREVFRVSYFCPLSIEEERKLDKQPKTKPYHIDKVKVVFAPVGEKGEIVPVAQFSYVPKLTKVRDAEGLLIKYHHNEKELLEIEYFDKEDKLFSVQKFFWSKGRLLCRALLDGNRVPLFAKTYVYSDSGNLLEESLWGDLTGSGNKLILDKDGNPSGERYTRRIEYSTDSTLPLTVSEDNGISYRYSYLEKTNLWIGKWTFSDERIVQRHFQEYDADHLVCLEISDNGTSLDSSNLDGVSQRLFKRYERDETGLPIAIQESYWDFSLNKEVLLKTIRWIYSSDKRIIEEAVFDAQGVHRYTCFTDYDSLGNLSYKTSPLGFIFTSRYREDGLLLECKEPGSLCKTFAYDPAGRVVCCQEGDDRVTSTEYDAKGRPLSLLNPQGHKISQKYDSFGNPIEIEFFLNVDENGASYRPKMESKYDTHGNLISSQLLSGELLKTEFNVRHQPIRVVHADGSEIRHLYRLDGALSQTIHPDGSREYFTYDPFERLLKKTLRGSSNELLKEEEWKYDSFLLSEHTDERGLKTLFFYDGAGRKVEERTGSLKTTFEYDELGFLTRTSQAGTSYIEVRDVEGRIIEQWEEDETGHRENHMTFFYNEAGKKIQSIRETASGNAVDLFSYDSQGRLTCHCDPLGAKTEWIYNDFFKNSLGQFVIQKITIDPLGQQTLETHDSEKRIVSVVKKDARDQILAAEDIAYTRAGHKAWRKCHLYRQGVFDRSFLNFWKYDLKGRVIEEAQEDKITRLEYDKKDRVISITKPSGKTLFSRYDGANRLLEMWSSDQSVHCQYSYKKGPEPTEIRDLVLWFN